MTKLKLIVAAMIVAIFTAGVPSGASAHYYHIKKIKVVGGKHFGGGGGPWPIFVCAGGIITSALVANATQNRELTWNEAASCGLLYWVNLPQ
jgi:hypothetical protein